jgi:hypothetical protein
MSKSTVELSLIPSSWPLCYSLTLPGPAQFSDSDLSESEITLKLKNQVFHAGVSMRWRRQRRRRVAAQLKRQGKNDFLLASEHEQLEDSVFSDSDHGWLRSFPHKKNPKKKPTLTFDLKKKNIISAPVQIDDSDLSDSGLIFPDVRPFLPSPLPGAMGTSFFSGAMGGSAAAKKKAAPSSRPSTISRPPVQQHARPQSAFALAATAAAAVAAAGAGPGVFSAPPQLQSQHLQQHLLQQHQQQQYVRPQHIAVPFTEVLYDPSRAADVPPVPAMPGALPDVAAPAGAPSAVPGSAELAPALVATWPKPQWWVEEEISELELSQFRENFNFSHEDGWREYFGLRSDVVKMFLYKRNVAKEELTFNEVRINFDPERVDVAVLFKLWRLLKPLFAKDAAAVTEDGGAVEEAEPAVKRRRLDVFRGKEVLKKISQIPDATWEAVNPVDFLTLHVREAEITGGKPAKPDYREFRALAERLKAQAAVPVAAPAAPALADEDRTIDDAWRRNGVVAEEEVRAQFDAAAAAAKTGDSAGAVAHVDPEEALELLRQLLRGASTAQDVVELKEALAKEAKKLEDEAKHEFEKKKAEIAELLGQRLELTTKRLDVMDAEIAKISELQRKPEKTSLSRPLVKKLDSCAFAGNEISHIRKFTRSTSTLTL